MSSRSIMNNSPYATIDYRNAVLLALKEKFPSFILGFFIVSSMTFFFMQKVSVKVNSARKVEQKNISIGKVDTYTVKVGDDLWAIAEKVYGSGYNALDIAKANKLSEPYTLNENQILIIPDIAAKKPTIGDITEKAAQTKRVTEYVVLPGDYLWQIAEKVYGDGNQMSKLIESNNIPYPYNVEEGQKLLVP